MSEAKFKFFSVGHGLFHAGKITVADGNFFTFIYDCGSRTPSVLKSSIDSCIEFFKGKNNSDNISKIDFLFVSHLHYDHINGIRPLIEKLSQNHISVSNVVLPYVDLYQRVILLLEALNHEEQSQDKFLHNNFDAAFVDYLDFYKNPCNYLKKLFVNKDNPQEEPPVFYIVNAPSDCFISYIRIPIDLELFDLIYSIKQDNNKNTNSLYSYDSKSYFFDDYMITLGSGGRNEFSSENRSDFDFILKIFYSEEEDNCEKHKASYQRKRVELKVANGALGIIVKDTWRFICFSTPLPLDKKVCIQSLYDEFVDITRANGFKLVDVFRKDNIERLRKHYKKMSPDLNSTSLLIYHFPLDCKDNVILHRAFHFQRKHCYFFRKQGSSLRKKSYFLRKHGCFLRKHNSFLLLGDVNLNTSVIYKSKYQENSNKSFLQYLYKKLLPLQDPAHMRGFIEFEKRLNIHHESSVNYVLVPHHGSDNSWNENIFYFLNYFNESSVYIVSSAVDGKHHPGREFMKSFLNKKYVSSDVNYEEMNCLFISELCSAEEFLLFLRGNNCLKWCNEKQFVDIVK
ncbi:MBL fold metallo-hydrolase [Succinivibrio dextrinosolvens]|uniref:Beta-lactamase superfamily domain-containing protein n=1 Tax=Succinivibrio dextrinosolvens TaxID=83771 RepID=A0A662ZER2_9GAMM|nr:MBL fold metallo-hydrolase [Succinivibrio dextrinosolvens]SFK51903.1 Beta-lactamase superfamily domain-containing protein [Succinivibrio dextrinosolvens]